MNLRQRTSTSRKDAMTDALLDTIYRAHEFVVSVTDWNGQEDDWAEMKAELEAVLDQHRPVEGKPGTLPYAEETDRLAKANHRLALSNYDNIWPWRYPRWRRVHREVKRGQQVVRDRLNLHADAMGWDRES